MTEAAPTAPGARVLILAVDGLDLAHWLRGADEGRLLWTATLLAGGLQAAVRWPPPSAPAARWATLATGVTADRHGISSSHALRPCGLLVEPVGAADLRCPPLWQQAWRAGQVARVVGWPASLGTTLPAHAPAGSALVADGFALAGPGSHRCWPLAPGSVAPPAERALVRAARMHPFDARPEGLQPLIGGFDEATQVALRASAADLLAGWSSVHNLGVHWAAMADWRLLMLRLDGLRQWRREATALGVSDEDAEAPWQGFLDMMIGRYLELISPHAHLLLVSDGAADRSADRGADGGLVLSGPGVAPGKRPAPVHAADIVGAVRSLLGLEGPATATAASAEAEDESQRCLQASQATAQTDDAALQWLAAQGTPPAPTDALRRHAQSVRDVSLAGWQAARLARQRRGGTLSS